MEQMRGQLQYDFDGMKGRSLSEIYKGALDVPTETRTLQNGNALYIYTDFWERFHVRREPCTVYLEVNPQSSVVTKAYSDGPGCYEP
jgi:hypothetical protein